MKKLSRHSEKTFSFVRLYLDDFYEIIELLKDGRESIKIEVGDFLIEEPKEVETLDKPFVRELRIETSRPFLKIWLLPWFANLETYDDDVKTLGLFTKIKDILAKSQSSIRFFANIWVFVVSIIIGISASTSAIYLAYLEQQKFIAPLALAVFGIAFSAFATFICIMNRRYQSLFILQRKSTKRNFFIRNKDQLALLTIGSLLTLATQWILKLFWGK